MFNVFKFRTQFSIPIYNFPKPHHKRIPVCRNQSLWVSKSFYYTFYCFVKNRTLKDIFQNNWTYQCHLILHYYEGNFKTCFKKFASLMCFPWKQETQALGVSYRLINQYYLPQNLIQNFYHSRFFLLLQIQQKSTQNFL